MSTGSEFPTRRQLREMERARERALMTGAIPTVPEEEQTRAQAVVPEFAQAPVESPRSSRHGAHAAPVPPDTGLTPTQPESPSAPVAAASEPVQADLPTPVAAVPAQPAGEPERGVPEVVAESPRPEEPSVSTERSADTDAFTALLTGATETNPYPSRRSRRLRHPLVPQAEAPAGPVAESAEAPQAQASVTAEPRPALEPVQSVTAPPEAAPFPELTVEPEAEAESEPELEAEDAADVKGVDEHRHGIPVSTMTIVLQDGPDELDLTSPLDASGEVMVTGSLELPSAVGESARIPYTYEDDALALDHDSGELQISSEIEPVSATDAVSAIGERKVIPAEKGSSKGLVVTLSIIAGILLVAAAGLLIYSFLVRS